MTDFFMGVRMLGRGIAMYGRNPKLLLLGLIPAVISAALFIAAFVALFTNIDSLAEAATWYADGWPEGARTATRVLAAVGIIGVSGLIGILSFTAVTLLIGDPFYEKISERIEERLGGVPGEVEVTWYSSLARSLGDSLRLMMITVPIAIMLFFGGFIPIVGQTVIPAIGAAVGGWFLTTELVGIPTARRGMRLPQRRAMLRANRPMALGFGVAVFLCFLVPLGAVLIMPAAVAGGTLLTRHALGQSAGAERLQKGGLAGHVERVETDPTPQRE